MALLHEKRKRFGMFVASPDADTESIGDSVYTSAPPRHRDLVEKRRTERVKKARYNLRPRRESAQGHDERAVPVVDTEIESEPEHEEQRRPHQITRSVTTRNRKPILRS